MELHGVSTRECALLSFLRRELSLSAGLVKRLKWQNAFLVNGERAHTDRIVHVGDAVTVLLDEAPEGYPAEDLPLSILYEDEWLIALDKIAGQLVHPSACRNDGTLANGLLHHYALTGQRCGVHPVTRLDRDTFGVVLVAKSSHVHAKLCQMLKAGQIEKTYHAAVYSCPQEDAGVIELPIYKLPDGSLLRTVDARGQRAVSEFRVLRRCPGTALLELHPVTGRTHQLRVHCLAEGFPVLGDPQYFTAASRAFSEAAGLFTQQLCAKLLRLRHPMTDEALTLCSKMDVILPEAGSAALS